MKKPKYKPMKKKYGYDSETRSFKFEISTDLVNDLKTINGIDAEEELLHIMKTEYLAGVERARREGKIT